MSDTSNSLRERGQFAYGMASGAGFGLVLGTVGGLLGEQTATISLLAGGIALLIGVHFRKYLNTEKKS